MIKPKRLCTGDTVAIVSLSSGMLGEAWAIHKLHIAQERLERDYGLRVLVMPNALKVLNMSMSIRKPGLRIGWMHSAIRKSKLFFLP